MTSVENRNDLVVSLGFVSALAMIGASAHLSMMYPDTEVGFMDGAFQTLYEERFTETNPLNEVAIHALSAVKLAVLGQVSQDAVLGADRWLFTAEEFEMHVGFEDNLIASAQEIARVKDVLSQRGITLLPVIVPDKAVVAAKYVTTPRHALVTSRHDTLLDHLAALDVSYLDATAALEQVGTGSFVKDDTHWSPAGSQAVANAVAELTGTMPLHLTAAQVTTRHKGEASFDGDLLRYAPTGMFRPLVGPQQQHLSRFETTLQSNAGLFGDAQVDVALVGTSFSAKNEWHFEGFLKQALQADLLNFATEGQGPFAPMQSFLASAALRDTPPKLVIWEIPARYTSKEM